MRYKQLLITAAVLLAGMATYAQDVKMTGVIKGMGDGTIEVHYVKNDISVIDTITIRKDRFSWGAAMPEPQKIYFMFPHQRVELFVEAGNIKLQGQADSLHKVKISGSKIQEEVEQYQSTLQDLEARSNVLYSQYGTGTAEEQLRVEQQLNAIRAERRGREATYISAHPKSVYSLSLVTGRAVMGSYEEVKPLYDLLDNTLLNTMSGKELTARLDVIKRSSPGTQMMDFTQNDPEGKPISFKDYEGKYVLIDFWASWCGPCRAENPNVLKAYNKYKDKNFTVIGISLDENAEHWKKAIKDDAMPWAQVSSLNGFQNEVSSYYGIRGIPSTLLVDPTGKIIARNLRGESLQQKLAEIFE